MADDREEMSEDELLLRRAAFGKQVEDFWSSDIGNYILERIKGEVEQAYRDVRDVDPRDGKSVEKIQNRIFRAESIKGWLEDAVVDGLQALNELESR